MRLSLAMKSPIGLASYIYHGELYSLSGPVLRLPKHRKNKKLQKPMQTKQKKYFLFLLHLLI